MDARDIPGRLFKEFGKNPKQHPKGFWYAETSQEEAHLFWDDRYLVLTTVTSSWAVDKAKKLFDIIDYTKPPLVIEACSHSEIRDGERGSLLNEGVNIKTDIHSSSAASALLLPIIRRCDELVHSPGVEIANYWEAERYPERFRHKGHK